MEAGGGHGDQKQKSRVRRRVVREVILRAESRIHAHKALNSVKSCSSTEGLVSYPK